MSSRVDKVSKMDSKKSHRITFTWLLSLVATIILLLFNFENKAACMIQERDQYIVGLLPWKEGEIPIKQSYSGFIPIRYL